MYFLDVIKTIFFRSNVSKCCILFIVYIVHHVDEVLIVLLIDIHYEKDEIICLYNGYWFSTLTLFKTIHKIWVKRWKIYIM